MLLNAPAVHDEIQPNQVFSDISSAVAWLEAQQTKPGPHSKDLNSAAVLEGERNEMLQTFFESLCNVACTPQSWQHSLGWPLPIPVQCPRCEVVGCQTRLHHGGMGVPRLCVSWALGTP